MSTRKHLPRTRGFRPEADALETRQMLSAVVTGTDSKGDAWTLRLVGPGALNVLKQPGADGTPSALSSATDIQTITVGGTDPLTSRIIGKVTPAAGSDGRVFFQNLVQLPGRSAQFSASGMGLLSIDMPGFWLGNTTPSTAANPAPAAAISIPDGVDTLRFGGVDTTFNRPAASSTFTPVTNADTVTLGLPTYGGTRIIIDRSISSSQAVPAANANAAATTVQHGVNFIVSGRLNLFQANSIEGDAANPPGQFSDQVSTATGSGGTIVFSGTSGTAPFFTSSAFKGGVTGQIGDVRIGGNATNFTTLVNDATGSGNDRISNFSVGGETNHVLVVAANGTRNVVFGKGMDNVDIFSHVINTLKANRGALDSNVYVDRSISRADFGGDVVNTKVLSGYQQSYSTIFGDIVGTTGTVKAPPAPSSAQAFGGMEVHVAGDVTNSVFAASVQPFTDTTTTPPSQVFGDPNQLVLTGGEIKAKVEGTIDNATATPSTPKQAFFAQHVQKLSGPVIPPSVPEAPYTGKQSTITLPGINSTISPHNNGAVTTGQLITSHSRSITGASRTHAAPAKARATTPKVTVARAIPKGPTAAKK